MKRIGALVFALMLVVTMLAPACLAEKTSATKNIDNLRIVSSSPEDGKEGAAVDNLSFTIQFDRDVQPASDTIKKSNVQQVSIVSEDGVKIPYKVYYSHDKEGLIMVAADVVGAGKDKQIKGGMKYVLTLNRDFQATDGSTLGSAQTITITTLNQQRSMAVYMILMVAMMGGMVFFTVRSTKKKDEKEKEEKKKEAVNPYKQAKKSGKSVEEIVAKDSKKKAKQAEAEARLKEEERLLEEKIREEIRREKNKRVSAPKPISATGSTYKVKVKNAEPKESVAKTNKGTTHPKKKGGKGKGKKKK